MSLSIWDPFHEMESLLDRYNRTSRKTLTTGDDKRVFIATHLIKSNIKDKL